MSPGCRHRSTLAALELPRDASSGVLEGERMFGLAYPSPLWAFAKRARYVVVSHFEASCRALLREEPGGRRAPATEKRRFDQRGGFVRLQGSMVLVNQARALLEIAADDGTGASAWDFRATDAEWLAHLDRERRARYSR